MIMFGMIMIRKSGIDHLFLDLFNDLSHSLSPLDDVRVVSDRRLNFDPK